MDAKQLDLRELASSQRLMAWAIVTWFLGFFPPAMLLTIPFQLYCVYRLGRALRLGASAMVLSMLLTLVPVVCVLVFLGINEKAVRVLRARGIHAGLTGAKRADFMTGRPLPEPPSRNPAINKGYDDTP